MIKRRMFKYQSLFVKMIIIFISAISIGSMIAFTIIMNADNGNIIGYVNQRVEDRAELILTLYTEGQISLDIVVEEISDQFVEVKGYNHFSDLYEDNKRELSELPPTNLPEGELFNGTINNSNVKFIVIKLDNQYYLIRPNLFESIIKDLHKVVATALLTGAIICSLLTVFAVRMMTKPISNLSMAAKQIAKGNFNVYIKNKKQDEIGELIDNFNLMAKELASMELLRNDFISSISHEFKTPLTSIIGYVNLLDNCEASERNEYIKIIKEETLRLSNLSSSILLLNKLESGNILPQKEEFRLDEQIRQVVLLQEKSWSEKNIKIKLDLNSFKYNGNKELLHQVWQNLLDNAIKFTPINGQIELNLKADEQNSYFIIKDHGVGIDKEQQQRIFEKFYQVDKSRAISGNGLGLSIAKKVIDIHNGEIKVRNNINNIGGVTFTVVLPIKKA